MAKGNEKTDRFSQPIAIETDPKKIKQLKNRLDELLKLGRFAKAENEDKQGLSQL